MRLTNNHLGLIKIATIKIIIICYQIKKLFKAKLTTFITFYRSNLLLLFDWRAQKSPCVHKR